jgi:predicted  nucleic acid-binding Zn-ribbon protein
MAWRCDSCGHTWYTGTNEPPKACAKCKRRNWNGSGRAVPGIAVASKIPKIDEDEFDQMVDKMLATPPRVRHAVGCSCFRCKPPKG